MMQRELSVVNVGSHIWDFPPDDGIMEVRLARALQTRLGGDYHTIVRGDVRLPSTHEAGSTSITYIPRSWGAIGFIVAGLLAAFNVSRRHPDAILMSSDVLGALILRILRILVRRPLVIQLQGHVLMPGEEYGPRWRRLAISKVMRTALSVADGVRCVNHDIARQARSVTSTSIVRVVGTRVEIDRFPQTDPSLPRDRLQIACVASLYPVKNHAMLLEAASNLAASGVPFELELIGDGPQRSMLEALAGELEIRSTVRFVGRVPHGDVVCRLQKANVFVLASISEGQPRAVLEAQAAGLPVVASRNPAHESIIQHRETGVLFDLGDAQELALVLSELLNSPEERVRLGLRAREYVIAHHSFGPSMDAFATFIHEVAQS